MAVVSCLSENRKFLVVAETRYAVRIAAEAMFNAKIIAGLQQRRVFVIKHVDSEGISSDIEESYTDEDEVGALRGPQNNAAQNPLFLGPRAVPGTTLPILRFECQKPAEARFDMD